MTAGREKSAASVYFFCDVFAVVHELHDAFVMALASQPHRAGAGRRRWTREGDHLLDGQAEFEPM